MIKKLALLLCLASVAQAPLQAYSYDREKIETVLTVTAGVMFAASLTYLIAMYPEDFGKFLHALADRRYCHHCDRHYYGTHKHVKVTTYTTVY